jgi:DNA/RNA-binding domain of Phe-tRNA-synthetase-like protein
MTRAISVVPHPLLDAGAFITRLAAPLGELAWDTATAGYPAMPPPALDVTDDVKTAVRALLRHGGYKPSGRGKPASEYLAAAAAEHRFPTVNPAVDVCNHVSLHSGLPVSVVDLDLVVVSAAAPLSIVVCADGTSYVFNPSGQTIDASGLLALADAAGPCGTPVKDAQRTKTHAGTRTLLSIVWGTHALDGRTALATRWYRALSATIPGATTEDVSLVG